MLTTKTINGQKIKVFNSPGYNFIFNLKNGTFLRWGEKKIDDPEYSPFGPEIMDIELSTICSGGCSNDIVSPCSFCYKSNTPNGKNMSFETFRRMFDKFPEKNGIKFVNQIAFGIGNIDANPELWKIMAYCREHDVIPNITINGNRMNAEYYDKLASLCGAVAVSLYDYDTCYNAVKELTDRGMKQINIHSVLSEETYDKCMQVLKDKQTDERLKKLNAIVFLWLKPKGKRNCLHQLTSMDKFKQLVNYAFDNGIRIGFDSCSASNFLQAIEGHEKYKQIEQMIEPCESTLFSLYINVNGLAFPCSFSEGEGYNGVDVVNCQDFLEDVWISKEMKQFRELVTKNKDCNNCRMCPIYDLKLCETKQ